MIPSSYPTRDEIARLRREHAEDALTNSDRAVSRIASELGLLGLNGFLQELGKPAMGVS